MNPKKRMLWSITFWLCQNSYWKWLIYSGCSHKTWWISIVRLNYKRVDCVVDFSCGKIHLHGPQHFPGRYGKGVLFLWGLRIDCPNLKYSFWVCDFATLRPTDFFDTFPLIKFHHRRPSFIFKEHLCQSMIDGQWVDHDPLFSMSFIDHLWIMINSLVIHNYESILILPIYWS